MAKKRRTNIFGIIIFFVIIIGISSFGSLISFITDLKWFTEIGYTGTFLTKIRTQLFIGIPLFIILFLIFNFYLTHLKKKYYKEMVISDSNEYEKKIKLGVKLGSLIIAFFFTVSVVSSMWFETLKFFNGQSFNIIDPIFSKDIGYYIFKLPFINSGLNLVMAMLFILIVVTVGFNVILISTKTTSKIHSGEKVIDFDEYGRKAKALTELFDKKMLTNIINQIAIFGSVFMLLLGVSFWLKTYDLLHSTNGTVYGAGFTDIAITLNVYRILAIVSIAGAFTFYFGAKKKNLIFSLALPATLIVISVLGGVGAIGIERFIVEPDQISKEMKYIEYNIKYTQKAYGLENVKEYDYPVKYNLTKEDLTKNSNIIQNIRINDYRPIKQIYDQIQSIRPYYIYPDIDVDRYYINGVYTQVFLAARELDQARLDSQAQTWINKVLKYTHGYGFTLSPVNSITPDGQPVLLVKDIPPNTTTDLKITQPEIYFGEKTNDYVIVNTGEQEFDYPSGSDNAMTDYKGDAGIKLTGLNKLLFTIKQGSFNILISSNINADSKIILNRNIINRVNKIAPFLSYGNDPNLVVSQEDGKLYWVIEAFTLSDKYPYSQPLEGNSFNYIRNSIKVVVDAYNGKTDFYIIDKEDALAETYSKIFPDLFKDISEMPIGIKDHLRYAQEYFDVQSKIYRIYHMANPTVFFGREDIWEISKEKYMDAAQSVESNFLMFQLPEENEVEFLLSVPFSPFGKNNMTALLVARNDGENYGELILYRFSKNENIPGTNMIESRIDQDSVISPQLTLWSQEGSNVLRGNLIVLPIENSLLYIEPIYLQADNENSLPEMKKVIAAYSEKIVMEDTLQLALENLFGEGYSGYTPGTDGVNIENKTISNLITEANELFVKSQEALKNGQWTEYGKYIEQLQLVLDKLNSIK